MTYLPQDFRGSLISKQRERSERNKQAQVEALINSGGSIRDKYALLWNQQMERYRLLLFFFLYMGIGPFVLSIVGTLFTLIILVSLI